MVDDVVVDVADIALELGCTTLLLLEGSLETVLVELVAERLA